jgi:hypothetical protein
MHSSLTVYFWGKEKKEKRKKREKKKKKKEKKEACYDRYSTKGFPTR